MRRISRAEKRVVVYWIRFARKHRDSHRLPVALFGVLFLDGFLMVIPSLLCLVAAVTISPVRWVLFSGIFAVAATGNNICTYFLGRLVSPDLIVSVIEYFHLESFWQSAERALHDYGSYATFFGAILGLPTQMMLALIGIMDSELLTRDPSVSTSFFQAVFFVFLGHGLKAFSVAALSRFGWLKLEKKFGAKA